MILRLVTAYLGSGRSLISSRRVGRNEWRERRAYTRPHHTFHNLRRRLEVFQSRESNRRIGNLERKCTIVSARNIVQLNIIHCLSHRVKMHSIQAYLQFGLSCPRSSSKIDIRPPRETGRCIILQSCLETRLSFLEEGLHAFP